MHEVKKVALSYAVTGLDSLRGSARIDSRGYFVAEDPGAYLVRIVKGGKPMLRFTPAYVRVPTGAAIRVDFSIDTGIR